MKILLALIAFIHTAAVAQRTIVVAKDGSGNFLTVQEAFNSIPLNNKKPVIILVKTGVYKEKLHLDSSKNFITLKGEDKFTTILTYDDHTGKLSPSGDTINTRTSWSFIIRADNFSATDITFENSAGFTAGQAVAVLVMGDKASFTNCRLIGDQDVLFTAGDQSRQFYNNCYIEGTTDFIFGASSAWFERCHIHSKKNSFITAASTPQGHAYGYVFNECVFTADTAVTKVFLGRPWRPYASVTYIRCYLDRHILPQGWDNWRNAANEKTARYAEYKNFGPAAAITNRVAWSKQLTDAEAKKCTIVTVLRGWRPSFAQLK